MSLRILSYFPEAGVCNTRIVVAHGFHEANSRPFKAHPNQLEMYCLYRCSY